ncbi:hypothetical protein GQ53DRAFT_853304 [Thozetella sp. PMI_491]|nr:hypothetical protein GQ53DRAFT_853304 [Thozetella sp. PMI_491]
MVSVSAVRFEHYHEPFTLGVQVSRPRLSWQFSNSDGTFTQVGYEVELTEKAACPRETQVRTVKCSSPASRLVPWPFDKPLRSRQEVAVRVRVWGSDGQPSSWSQPSCLEVGLLEPSDWHCDRIAAPWSTDVTQPGPEQLFRREFSIDQPPERARLYITAQGVYEAEINGHRVGDQFLAPGWTTYDGRLQYQCYDVASTLGWFSGRIGFEGGLRNIWGSQLALLAQLEITSAHNATTIVTTDASWRVSTGPIRLAELYDGEKYDATQEVPMWSSPAMDKSAGGWHDAMVLEPLPASTELTAGFSEPVRRIETIQPITKSSTPSGKTIVDFGQNLVGYVRLSGISGSRGHKITLRHAEVLEGGELGVRPLRICDAIDEYTLKGFDGLETYEPRFTFHGFRYVQVDGWPGDLELGNLEAVVCHTDMKSSGAFSCSEPLLNQLYQNVCWGMRGNFLSVPTDCPQRDERLGWSGDLSVFAPTATLIYDCFGILKNWLVDARYDQKVLGGVPSMVTPNSMLPDPKWLRRIPCAIWHDVVILAPWALYEETGDETILADSYDSMVAWLNVLPRAKTSSPHLWDPAVYQLGDWLDPAAPPDKPWKSSTDSKMVANMFLVRSLDLMVRISKVLGKPAEQSSYQEEAQLARAELQREYITPGGRIVSDSQTSYALAICFDILDEEQKVRAGARLAELVRRNNFMIGTGFAGTPFICEALARTQHLQIAYSVLLGKNCPSWLYPVTMGATTVWERWDSMLPDGTINPGEMTSFNHYALGAIAKFLFERIAGLQRVDAGWKTVRIAPAIGATFSHAAAHHVTPQGTVSCSWETLPADGRQTAITLDVTVPHGTTAEVVVPDGESETVERVGPGSWSFRKVFTRPAWPVEPLPAKG